MTIPFEKLKARLLANPEVKAEYDALAPEFEISAELVKARLRAGLSQAELAARMGTSQSTIARLESGQTLPTPRRCCATPRRRAASSTCGFRRLDAAFANDRPRNRTKSYSGAPRSMKMGNTRSPFPYDAAACPAIQSANLRRPTILHYATSAAVFPISRDGPVTLR
jgi:DNA-binding XRE family transcriptional regulator